MDFVPVDAVAGVEDDVRVVSVIWRGDTDYPVVDYFGCSGFEAAGLLRAALKRLEWNNADDTRMLEDDEEMEEEDED